MTTGTRRLAAILSADVVGYGRLMADDEDATIRAVTVRREEVELHIRHHEGARLVDFTGDNFLAEFQSAAEAADCAIEIQEVVAALNKPLPPERRMEFRIGIHLGEVQDRDGRLFGNGVNVAARLERLAEPGGVCVSEQVHREVLGRTRFEFRDLGEQQLKNIPEPVHVFALDLPDAPRTLPTGRSRWPIAVGSAALVAILGFGWWVLRDVAQEPVATSTDRQKSIAVLPFVNMSPDSEQEYFSDGLSEDILNLLVKVSGLKVTARTSSFAFKGKNEDVRSIGRALDVNTVLEGSVRRSGERVRITAQLIDVESGMHVWAETYDRTLTDIFAVQDSVASEILEALQIHVGAAPTRGRPTESSEAYSLFLRARSALNQYDGDSAEAFLREAIELDPEFAEAHELLAFSYGLQTAGRHDPHEAQRLTYEAAARALAIDPGLVFARALWESGNVEGRSFQKEIQAYERVVRADPSNGGATELLIYLLLESGYFGQALRVAERHAGLDPLSASAHAFLYEALKSNGRRAEALSSLKVSAQLGFSYGVWELGNFYLEEGRDEMAIEQFESVMRERDLPSEWIRELIVGARDPETGQAHLDQLLSQLEVPLPFGVGPGYSRFYLAMGFLDRYFEEIFELGVFDAEWSPAENSIYYGTIDRKSGFTAHPKYLEVAEDFGLFKLWNQRGPPDHCEKLDGQWACE